MGSCSSADILKCQIAIKKLKQHGKSGALQWITSHYGIILADESAKKGASVQQVNNNPVLFSNFKRVFNKKSFNIF